MIKIKDTPLLCDSEILLSLFYFVNISQYVQCPKRIEYIEGNVIMLNIKLDIKTILFM